MGRDDFYHPFTPYEIQLQLMLLLYETVDSGCKVGLFESPTGTGKTLSLICSTMTWLREYKKKELYQTVDIEEDDDEPEWVVQQYRENIVSKQKNLLKDYEIYLDEIKFDEKYDEKYTDDNPRKKRKKIEISVDEEMLPDDYESGDESLLESDRNEKLSTEIRSLMHEIEGVPSTTLTTTINPVKIFYSSRTHSQLSQFSSQLSGLSFPSSFDDISERIKYLPLGSRKQYCINDKIRNKSVQEINDACVEMQRDSSKSCQFFPAQNTQQLVKLFTDLTFTEIHDIEDLVSIGDRVKICPYYSVRSGIDASEIISLPYQLLLEKNSREILNLNLKESIVIIDEAHNLIDIIQLMNSSSVSLSEIKSVNELLMSYFKKFKKRFNGGNRINLMKLIKILKILEAFLENQKIEEQGVEFNVMEIYDNNTSDLTNFYKLETYLHKSKIAYKLEIFMGHKASSQPLLFKIVSFLKSLSNPSEEGKFFFSKSNGEMSMNYLLLNPLPIFTEIVEKSRSVILAGGTMEPMEDYENYLFPSLSKDLIRKFSCDHIIPKQNLETYIVEEFDRTKFEFNFQNRENTKMFISLLNFIIQSIREIPNGVIVFFPSFRVLEMTVEIWKKNGLYDKLDRLKKVFRECKSGEDVFKAYSEHVAEGSILLSVMNGKLSEGINFNDELCRGVIVVGVPYPNIYLADMVLKQKFVREQLLQRTGNVHQADLACREMVENIAMRIVNQSCGRCIRHAKDYSVIILLDSRFNRLQPKLSKWIRDRIQPYSPAASNRFFAHHKAIASH